MNWYRDHKEQWKEMIETVASEEHRTVQIVEKDTLQSMIIFALSSIDIPLVFKGGTSLSKSYGLINRFSEDIDISSDRKLTESEKRKIKTTIINIGDELGLELVNPDDIRSRHNYNRYVFEYRSLFSVIPLEIVLETSFSLEVYPVETREIGSQIGRFCKDRDLAFPVPFEASSVRMKVQSLERTFVDKVFAVCDYMIQNKQYRESRHLYDIARILPWINFSDELNGLVDKVREDRRKLKNNPSAQPEYDIPDMLRKIIESHFYESDYSNITSKLLYEDVSYDDAIANGIAKIADTDIFNRRGA